MSKTGASPEFERKMQEIAEKTAHMVIPRSEVQTPITEPRYPAWTEEPTTPAPVIPAQAVEAAARAMAGFNNDEWLFEPPIMDGVTRSAEQSADSYLREAATILEAAAPHMLARHAAALEAVARALSDAEAFGRLATHAEVMDAMRAEL